MYDIPSGKIPAKGFVLAYYEDGILFSPYTVTDGKICVGDAELDNTEEPREIHFFDEAVEYRRVRRESRGDSVEVVLTEDEEQQMDPDLVYSETVLLKSEYAGRTDCPERIRMISRYRYSEHDTLVLRNYRIAMCR